MEILEKKSVEKIRVKINLHVKIQTDIKGSQGMKQEKRFFMSIFFSTSYRKIHILQV